MFYKKEPGDKDIRGPCTTCMGEHCEQGLENHGYPDILGPEISGARVVATLLYAGRELMAFWEERWERTQSTSHQPRREDGMVIFLSR